MIKDTNVFSVQEYPAPIKLNVFTCSSMRCVDVVL